MREGVTFDAGMCFDTVIALLANHGFVADANNP